MSGIRDSLLTGRAGGIVVGLLLIAAGAFGAIGLATSNADASDVVPGNVAAAEAAVRGPVDVDSSLVSTKGVVAEGQTDSAQGDDLEEQTREMLQDHLGLTDGEAGEWTDEMIEHMSAVHGEQTDEMLEWCTENWDGDGEGSAGPGMMDDGYRGGMMGGSGHMGGFGRMGGFGGSQTGQGFGGMGGGMGGMMGF